MAEILIIDDDAKICQVLSELATSMGHSATTAGGLEEGLQLAHARRCDLVLLDLQFPGGNGLEILPELLKTASQPEVIIITGSGVQGAELAFKHGAWDYVAKPFLVSEIALPISRALQYRQEAKGLSAPLVLKRSEIIGDSAAINQSLEAVGKAAVTDASVLISGETGTGKELFARAIHENSQRAANNFVVVDCGALPETLAEGVLFGHEKGAFTGADKRRVGLVEQAQGGTLYLDEVGELPVAIQKALLRVLQEKCLRPLGAGRELDVDFRLVAATNRHLEEMVEGSRFRGDLLFRIRAIEIQLPPLRDRKEDIRAIANHVIQRLCRQYGMTTKGVSLEFYELLDGQAWPGNVRELINLLEHSLAAAAHDATLVPKHTPYQYRMNLFNRDTVSFKKVPLPETERPDETTDDALLPLKAFRDRCEREYLQRLLARCQGDRKKACLLSGVSQSQLYALLKKHNLASFKSSA